MKVTHSNIQSNIGLSIFAILSQTSTPQGNALLRQWLLSPLQSVQEIRDRQDSVEFFVEHGLQDTVKCIRASLKRAGDVQTGLKSIRRGGFPSFLFMEELMVGVKRMVGKKGPGASEWKSLLQVYRLMIWVMIVFNLCF